MMLQDDQAKRASWGRWKVTTADLELMATVGGFVLALLLALVALRWYLRSRIKPIRAEYQHHLTGHGGVMEGWTPESPRALLARKDAVVWIDFSISVRAVSQLKDESVSVAGYLLNGRSAIARSCASCRRRPGLGARTRPPEGSPGAGAVAMSDVPKPVEGSSAAPREEALGPHMLAYGPSGLSRPCWSTKSARPPAPSKTGWPGWPRSSRPRARSSRIAS
jgi:hypothetical protein